jgi:hypothetical protein
MDHVAKSIMQAYQEIKEKSLSAKQKKLDKDKDGDIDGDDFASMRNDKKRQQSEEAPADPIKKAPARKGDKSNSDSSILKGVQEAFKAGETHDIGGTKVKFTKAGNKGHIGYSWKKSNGKEGYEEYHPKRFKNHDDVKANIASEIKYQSKRRNASESVEQVDEGPLSHAADDRLGRDFGSNMRIPKTSAAKKYLKKKQADKNAEINKNDPKTAKRGYGRSIVDVQKALSKAKKKGKDTEKLKKGLGWRQRNSAQKSKLPSDKK